MRRYLFACVAVLGCKNEPRQGFDAGRLGDAALDAMPDATADAMPDAMPEAVRVLVIHDPPDGYTVLFYDPAGQLVARETTDATGLASATLPQGGTVIVINDPVANTIDDIRAIFGVEPGDLLHVGPVIDQPIPSPVYGYAMSITVPAYAGASIYSLGSRCGRGDASPGEMYFDLACGGQPMRVLAHALDADGKLIGAQRGTVTAGQSGALSGPWLAPERVSLSVTSSPEVPGGVYASLSPMLDDRSLSLGQLFTNEMSIAVAPASIVDARDLFVAFSRPNKSGFQHIHRIHGAAETALQLDVAAEQLPWYSDFGSYDVATRKITFTRSAGAPLDGQVVRLQFTADQPPPRAWNCVIPPDWLEVTLPELPADFVWFDPDNPVLVRRQVIPTGISASAYPGYDELRRGTPLPVTVGASFHMSTIESSSL